MKNMQQTLYVIDQLVNQEGIPAALVRFARLSRDQLARRSELDLIIKREEDALEKEFKPLEKQDYGLYTQKSNQAWAQRVEPFYRERKSVEGASEGYFMVPAGRYQEGQVLDKLPKEAISDFSMEPYRKLLELLELYKPENIQKRRKALKEYKAFLKPEEVRLIDNLLMYLKQPKI